MQRRSNWIHIVIGLVILVAALFITGFFMNRSGDYIDVVDFSEMEYNRPDPEKLYKMIDNAKEYAQAGKASDAADEISSSYKEYAHMLTMESLANIRYSIDMTDEYYSAEYEYMSDLMVDISYRYEMLYTDLAATDAAEKLEKDYFGEGFFDRYKDYDSDTLTYITELFTKENELELKYRQTVGDRYFEYGDDIMAYSTLIGGEFSDEEYDAAEKAYYAKYNPILGEIYIDLIKVRQEIASVYGYESYADYAYENIHGRDYTPAEVRAYTNDVIKYLVPVFTAAVEGEKFSDFSYYQVDEDDMMAYLESLAENTGGAVKDAVEFMKDYNLYNISPSDEKMDISFQTYIKDYESPFLFINPTGYSDDLFTIAHEFGHYTDAFKNYNASSDTDTAETFSQGLEYLSILYNSLGDDEVQEDLRRAKMADSLSVFIEQSALNEFEERVYALTEEELTIDNLNNIYCQVCKDFGYYVEEYDDYYHTNWIDITHLFEYPYYVASYVVSNDAAMQIYELETNKKAAGLRAYESLLDREAGETFLQVLDGANMKSPFEAGRVKTLADTFAKFYEIN